MFFDGDGDRLDIVAPDGRQISPAFNLIALAPRLRALFPDIPHPNLYVDLKANPLAIIRIARQGFGVHVIRNGHSQIKQALGKNAAAGFVAAVEESAHYYLNLRREGAVFPIENTLFYALLTARAWREDPTLYRDLLDLQQTTFREREWGYHFPNDDLRAAALAAVEEAFVRNGWQAMHRMADGAAMDATLLRDGLPFVIDADTPLTEEWTQVAQRASQSERGLARWEVTAGTAARRDAAVRLIEETVRRFQAGPKYVGVVAMNIFELRDHIVGEFAAYTKSFLNILDPDIREFVQQELARGKLWPDALVQLSPAYDRSLTVADLVEQGILHPLCRDIFQVGGATKSSLHLYRHQKQAIDMAAAGRHYVVTTGTGSGKSLTYIIPIVNHILRNRPEDGRVRAIIVYR
jgi:hypothetical protein